MTRAMSLLMTFGAMQNVVVIASLITMNLDQLFWYPGGIARSVLTDKTCLVNIPPVMCFMYLKRIG